MRETLLKGAEELGLSLSEEALSRFMTYKELLVEKNKVMNLTAITEPKEIATLHFLDSIAILTMEDFKKKSVIDIGSGAGFPGLPMKIAEPEMRLTLLDALQKRVDFLSDVCKEAEIPADCLHARAEEAAEKGKGMRDHFDFAVSRAVARLNVLCELCLPFLKKGGKFLALKSVDSEEEINEAKNAIKLLGGKIIGVKDYPVPCTDIIHRVVVIEKLTETPKGYPRRFAKIKKAPL